MMLCYELDPPPDLSRGEDTPIWNTCWALVLRDQSIFSDGNLFSSSRVETYLSTSQKVTLWKVCYAMRLVTMLMACYASLVTVIFPAFSFFSKFPIGESFVYALLASYWSVFYGAAIVVVVILTPYGNAQHACQMIYFSWQIRHLVSKVKALRQHGGQSIRSISKRRYLARDVALTMAQWQDLTNQWLAHAPNLRLASSLCVSGLWVCTLLWTYALCYFSLNLIMLGINFCGCIIAVGTISLTLASAALIDWEQAKMAAVLFGLSRDLASATVRQIATRKLLLSWITNEVYHPSLQSQCGPFFVITFENCILVSFF